MAKRAVTRTSVLASLMLAGLVWLRNWLNPSTPASNTSALSDVKFLNQRRKELAVLSDDELKNHARSTTDRMETIASAAVIAGRVLGLEMFDVQLQGALALTEGRIAEMQTGEGKTLAAVPAAIWYAKSAGAVHVLTVNDYLARRDARWMQRIYEWFGLSVGYIQREMPGDQRRQAYACNITYATANEIGFDYLRDQWALDPGEQVHREFKAAVIDEADSILIDEARIPLVIAGGATTSESLPYRVDSVIRNFQRGIHYTLDEYGRNIALTDAGTHKVEAAFRCGNIFTDENLALFSAVQDSIHAHALLRRDVDYLVKDGRIEPVDEFKGRIIQDRRWPAGLHTALEAKEGVALQQQGQILGSITLQNLVALYPQVCGMTGTAATQADEFKSIYGLDVEVIPTNQPVVREDHPDKIFRTKAEKENAVLAEIQRAHAAGQPVLVGTTSVEESERFSARLQAVAIAHQVLNARNEEREAAIIAQAGQRGTVTISTNMAGRGTDIQLGDGVAELGGLYVIGTNKHESRRIDHQLRGRAGRQGDPGRSQFCISLEDDLLVRYGMNDPLFQHDPDQIQRVVEAQNLEIRTFLNKYESVIEGQRLVLHQQRQKILTGETVCESELERLVLLTTIDDLWTEYLNTITELRAGIHWVSFGGRDPLHSYLSECHRLFQELEGRIEEEAVRRIEQAAANRLDPRQRGATWTYLTTDQPLGTMTERFMRGVMQKLSARK